MKITVTGINPDEAVLVRGTSALGWPGKFGCPLVAGDAIFIPARGFEHNLRVGNSITVETSFEDVTDVQLVDPEAAQEQMRALVNPCDYAVIGTVVSVAPLGNVVVSVRGLSFTLDRNELAGLNPAIGDWLSFDVHRLTLWDTAT